MRGFASIFFSCCLSGLLISGAIAQTGKPAPGPSPDSEIGRGVALASAGQCTEALPILTSRWEKTTSRELRLRAGTSIVRCAIKLDQLNLAEGVLYRLNRDYPVDPDVLFLSVHAYSDLSARSSQILATSAPDSLQARELYAEALETQQQWDDAAAVYRKLLVSFPNEPGIHFRLGRILLSRPNPPADVAAQAKKEFETELAIDPKNAAAEFVLGELARQAQQWDEAIRHYRRATELDAGFSDAFVSLGSALESEGKYSEAVEPLERAVKLQPQNPIAHFALANALNRTGRHEEAQREFAIHRQLTQKHDANALPSTPQAQTPE